MPLTFGYFVSRAEVICAASFGEEKPPTSATVMFGYCSAMVLRKASSRVLQT